MPEARNGPAIPQHTPVNWKKLSPTDAQASYGKLLEEYTDVAADRPLRVLKMVLPEYPESERRHGIWGDVEIVFIINEAGAVTEAVATKAPDEALAKVSLAAIRQWRFEPITQHGIPVKFRCMQSFPFRLP